MPTSCSARCAIASRACNEPWTDPRAGHSRGCGSSRQLDASREAQGVQGALPAVLVLPLLLASRGHAAHRAARLARLRRSFTMR